ncbi:TetR/AcrR family transcriptional regulator [Bacteroidota bacterium]
MDRKQQIVQLAQMLVRQRGFDSFSYQDLSDHLGIRKASIHHHFPTKEDLGIALIDNMISWITHRFDEMENEGISAWKRLDQILVIMRTGCEHGCMCPINSLQSSAGVMSDKMRKRLDILEETELKAFVSILNKGLEEGSMSFEGEPRHMAMVTASIIKGATLYGRRHGKETFDSVISQLKRLLVPN